jgi:hypothetical protein
MTGSIVHNALALSAIALLCLCLIACGGVRKSTDSTFQVSSRAAVAGGVAATTSSTPPIRGYVVNDYDNDDHSSNYSDDGDNDDSNKPKDKDNDSDNKSNSYYDRDDKSVRGFGQAASAVDAQAVTAVVRRYFAAAAAQDGTTACSLVVSDLARAVPEDLGRSPGPPYARGNTCAVVMSKMFKENRPQLTAYAAMLKVTGVRLKGDRGLAVLGFRTLPGRQIGVTREGDVWKLAALLDSELP